MENLNTLEVSNVGRPNINRSHVSRKDSHTKTILKQQADIICKNVISEEYIRTVLNKFESGYVYKNDKNTIVGFCLWKTYSNIPKSKLEPEKRYLYVLLICSQHPDLQLGSYILNDVETYCSSHDIPEIRLQPLNEDLQSYYEKFGYTTYMLENNKIIEMNKLIRPMVIGRNRSRTRKSRTTNVNRTTNRQSFNAPQFERIVVEPLSSLSEHIAQDPPL